MKFPVQVTVLGAGADNPPPVDPPPTPSGAVRGITRYGATPHQLHSPTAWCTVKRPSNVAVHPDSAAKATELDRQARVLAKPYLGLFRYSVPTFTVPPDFPRVPVAIHGTPPNYKVAMQEILASPGVPIPPEYVNQGDSDDECLIYDPSTDTAWEFWRLRPLATPRTITVLLGGVSTDVTCNYECSSMWQIVGVSTHPGISRNHNAGTYPHAPATAAGRATSENTNMSVAAGKVTFLSTLLTVEDIQLGLDSNGHLTNFDVGHPINLTLGYGAPSPQYHFPASATDAYTAGNPVWEGDRYFFDETVYTDAYINSLNVHPICRLIIKMTRDHTMVPLDKTGGWNLEIDGEPEILPYLNGTLPSAVLDHFPWIDLKCIGKQTGTDANGNPIVDYGSTSNIYPT